MDSHGGCRLVIHNVQESDAGLYMCVAHNTMGRTKCSTRLRVVGMYHYLPIALFGICSTHDKISVYFIHVKIVLTCINKHGNILSSYIGKSTRLMREKHLFYKYLFFNILNNKNIIQ